MTRQRIFGMQMGSMVVLASLAVGLGVAPGVRAQGEPPPPPTAAAIAAAQARWQHEPDASEVVAAALRYFRVEPEALDSLRTASRVRALLPTISGDYNFRDSRFGSIEGQRGVTMLDIDQNSNSLTNGVTARVSWDPRELVFSGDEINVYGLVGVQRDLMLEVLRAYFARKQLMLTIALRPPEDPIALASLTLRVEEFTAVLDMLTGRWFTQTAAARARNRRGRSSR